MEEKKVLICAPVGDGKEYSINEWFNWIANQPYKNFEVAVCVNGRSEETLLQKITLFNQVEINNKKITVLYLPFDKYQTTKIRISDSREILRNFAIDHGFDYIFFLDTDTIPVTLDAIPRLMAHNKGMVSGLYFYKNTKQPIVIDKDTHTNLTLKKIQELTEKKEILEVSGFGFGVVLIRRDVFEKIAFDYNFMKEYWTDDFQYCEYMEKAGIKRYFDPWVVCKHFHRKEFTEKKE